VLLKFSTTIPIPLALLLLTGIGLSAVRLGSFANLVTTEYGYVLAAKLALVLALLALAAYNRYRLTPRFVSAPVAASSPFARSIFAELAMVVAILGVLGFWRFIPPPTGMPPVEQPTVAYLKGDGVTAFITISPPVGYARSLTIALLGSDSKPLKADKVWITVTYTTMATAPVRRLASPIQDGRYRLEGVVMPNPGLWKFQIDFSSGSTHAMLETELLLNSTSVARLINSQAVDTQQMPATQGRHSMPGMADMPSMQDM
jgi:copper transport protein